VQALPEVDIIDRVSVNAWDDPKVSKAIEATGRKKLIFAGVSLEVCAAFPAITAIGRGYDAYVAVDACGTFSQTKREAGLMRMHQAGVILSDYATLTIEVLKDNSRPEAGGSTERWPCHLRSSSDKSPRLTGNRSGARSDFSGKCEFDGAIAILITAVVPI
jgi:Isochorismatase family